MNNNNVIDVSNNDENKDDVTVQVSSGVPSTGDTSSTGSTTDTREEYAIRKQKESLQHQHQMSQQIYQYNQHPPFSRRSLTVDANNMANSAQPSKMKRSRTLEPPHNSQSYYQQQDVIPILPSAVCSPSNQQNFNGVNQPSNDNVHTNTQHQRTNIGSPPENTDNTLHPLLNPVPRILFCILLALLFATQPALWPEALALTTVTTFDMVSLTLLNKLHENIRLCLLCISLLLNIILAIILSVPGSFFPFSLLFAVVVVTALVDCFLEAENKKSYQPLLRVVHYILKIIDLLLSVVLLVLLRIALDSSISLIHPILIPLLQWGFMLKYAITVGCVLLLVNTLLSLAKDLSKLSLAEDPSENSKPNQASDQFDAPTQLHHNENLYYNDNNANNLLQFGYNSTLP